MKISDKLSRADRLRAVINEMIDADERISTRNIMNRLPDDFRYPNAITRPHEFRTIYLEGVREQARIREVASRSHSSRTSLEAKLLKQATKIDTLQSQVEMLIASHRAMYAAVGEMGGGRAWLKFFEKHQKILKTLEKLQAIPSSVTSLRIRAPTNDVQPDDNHSAADS